MRETAEGLGVVLDKLSESVTEVLPRRGDGFAGDGYEDGEIEAGRRTRGFKLRQYQDDVPASTVAEEQVQEAEADVAAEAAAAVGAAESAGGQPDATVQDEVMDILKKARDVAADAIAPPVVMPARDRADAQAKLKELFIELGMKRVEIMASIFNGPEEAGGVADLFSLSTPESAKTAYNGIDAMIMMYLNAGHDAASGGAGSVYEGHEAALSATEQLKAFLQNESPEKAFTRFREVNRSNILGLLQ